MIDKKFATHDRNPFFDLASPYISKESKVLDIGPGEGNFSGFHKRNDFYLFEGNPMSAELLKKEHPNTFIGMLPKLPFESNFFDVIHCSHVVEHLQPQEFFDTLVEMDRCLKKNGVLVISAPMFWEGFYNDLSHVKAYNPNIYVKYLCPNDVKALTRLTISTDYQVKNLQYRYRESTPFHEYHNSKNSLIVKVFLFGLKVLRKLGLRKYDRTGYTIILEKNAL